MHLETSLFWYCCQTRKVTAFNTHSKRIHKRPWMIVSSAWTWIDGPLCAPTGQNPVQDTRRCCELGPLLGCVWWQILVLIKRRVSPRAPVKERVRQMWMGSERTRPTFVGCSWPQTCVSFPLYRRPDGTDKCFSYEFCTLHCHSFRVWLPCNYKPVTESELPVLKMKIIDLERIFAQAFHQTGRIA